LKNFSPGLASAVGAQTVAPVELVDVYLDTGTLSLANHPTDVVVDGKVYTAFAWKRETLSTALGEASQKVVIRLDGVDRSIVTSIFSRGGRLDGRRVVLSLVMPGLWTEADRVQLMDGYADAPLITIESVQFEIVNRMGFFSTAVPRRIYHPGCGFLFGREGCGVRSEYQLLVTSGSAGASDLEINVSKTPLPSAEIARGGWIVMTTGATIGQGSPVLGVGSTNLQLTAPLSEVPAVGDLLTLYPTCDKTPVRCEEFTNTIRFGGFPNVPVRPTG